MTWMRLDDKFWRNPKMRLLSHAARGVWTDALSYCGDAAELTGYLTCQEALERATGNKRLVGELVNGGAWEAVNGGYLVHDFEHYVPKTSTERVRKWREKKRSESVSETLQVQESGRFTSVSPLARVRRVPEPEPVPTRPVGSLEPPVIPLQTDTLANAGYGIPAVSMHVSESHPISKILGGLELQPRPHEETA